MSVAQTPAAALRAQPEEPWEGPPQAARRESLRRRAEAHGVQVLEDAELVEILFDEVPAAAEALLEAHGGLAAALAAPAAQLARQLGAEGAVRLAAARDLARRLAEAPLRRRTALSSWSAVSAFLKTCLAGERRELLMVLFLDRKNQLIRPEVLGRGTVDHAPVYPREILTRALELGASALVLAHNHPSGDPSPSTADVEITRQVVEAAKALGLKVHDHIVVGAGETASLRALGLM